MSSNISRKVVFSLSITILVALALIPITRLFSADSPSVAYLKSKTLSPWSIMALSAAGESPSLDSLTNVFAEKAIDLETPILAITSAGEDPRSFGSTDLISALRAFYDGTQLGESGIVNDDIFGLLALISSGESMDDPVLTGIKNFILSNQNDDGGFSFAISGDSDTNTTAAAIMALRASGMAPSESPITEAVAYLKASQNDDGGFPYDPNSSWGTDSDASSDAWVLMAIIALGEDPLSWQKGGETPRAHLETLKQENGMYLYQTGGAEDSFTPVTTSYALLALFGKTLPIQVIVPEAPSLYSFSVQVEGKTGLICDADGVGRTAVDALVKASVVCEFTYHMQSSSFGDYVDEIAGESASGSSGWLYTVNGEMPSVGAGAYNLEEGDSVRWYFGNFDGTPAGDTTRTEVPLSVVIPEPPPSGGGGGSPNQDTDFDDNTVSMIVDISSVSGTSDEPVGFGTTSRGGVTAKVISLKNSGEVATTLSTAVSGDAVFRRYLRLNDKTWRDYRVTLSASMSTTTGLTLTVPADYDGSGTKTGSLIFFATPVAQ